MSESYLPKINKIPDELRFGRNVHDGYQRGWGLEYGDLKASVQRDPDFVRAKEAAGDRTVQDPFRQMNIFLIIKFFMSQLDAGCIIEFGSYRGGSALFMASLCKTYMPNTKVYGLDTFAGMPATDPAVDAHNAGDFSATSLDELEKYRDSLGLDNLYFVKGLFEDTTRALLAQCGPVAMTHIDCDIRSAASYSYNAVKPSLCRGAYIVFDDATVSSCIGATEVVEREVIARDGLLSEQIFPHFVFRGFFNEERPQ